MSCDVPVISSIGLFTNRSQLLHLVVHAQIPKIPSVQVVEGVGGPDNVCFFRHQCISQRGIQTQLLLEVVPVHTTILKETYSHL